MTTDRKRGYLYILLAAMLYSTTEVALKALGGAFAPMQVTVERVLLGAAALMPFALNDLKKRDIQLTKADWGYFTLLGFLTVTLHMSLCRWRCCTWTPQLHRLSTRAILCSRWRWRTSSCMSR